MHKNDLQLLSDDALLSGLSSVLKCSRRSESMLVAHIGEVDRRRLYAREASPSMFEYCVKVLNLSEAEAYLRITAARAARRFPLLLTMLEDGRLHLSGIKELAPHLTEANCEAVLARATHKSKREIKELVAELAPKPDIPAKIRKLPQREPNQEKAQPEATTIVEPTRSGPSSQASPRPPARTEPDPREEVEPLSPASYKVQFTASAGLKDKLERLAALMPEADLASVVEAAVTEKLERLEAKRYGKVKTPRTSLEDADTSPGVRGIPAAVKRFVWERDSGRCTYVGPRGRRCPERHRPQFHHDDPYGLGGDRSAGNIRLLCAQHNLYEAEKDYGKELMDSYRRSPDRVSEPAPAFQLAPERVEPRSVV